MKPFSAIKADTRIQLTKQRENYMDGYILLRGSSHPFVFVCSIDQAPGGIAWEHISVHIAGERRKTPTWAEMCEVKEIFWGDDEEVHQIHPKSKQYVHGAGSLYNILHLWRPVDGWKEEE